MKCNVEEELFQKAFDEGDWEKMWFLVQNCCRNVMLSKLKNMWLTDLDEKVTDATITCMDKIRKGQRPKRLANFCYFPCIAVLWNKKTQNWDQTLSLDEYLENYKEGQDIGYKKI